MCGGAFLRLSNGTVEKKEEKGTKAAVRSASSYESQKLFGFGAIK